MEREREGGREIRGSLERERRKKRIDGSISKPKNYMVTGGQRKQFFNEAISRLSPGIPINTILFPMEGDPEAAALYWQLALDTNGAFVAPSRDWP